MELESCLQKMTLLAPQTLQRTSKILLLVSQSQHSIAAARPGPKNSAKCILATRNAAQTPLHFISFTLRSHSKFSLANASQNGTICSMCAGLTCFSVVLRAFSFSIPKTRFGDKLTFGRHGLFLQLSVRQIHL